MDTETESPLRRSNRLRGQDPEYEAKDDPEETLKKSFLSEKNAEMRNQEQRSSTNLFHSPLNHGGSFISKSVHHNYTRKYKTTSKTSNKGLSEGRCIRTSSAPLDQGILSSRSLIVIVLTVIVVVVLAILPKKFESKEANQGIQNSFPEQTERLWGFVSHGVNNEEPFVLLLVHDGQHNLAGCLAKRIAKEVASSRTKTNVKPIIVDGKKISPDNLLTLKEEMAKSPALVIQHVEHLSRNTVEHLHYILDVHEPWVPAGAYVLTLEIPNINETSKESYRAVEAFVRNKWSQFIRKDHLDPIVIRICNFVYFIRKEKNPCNGSDS